jgi:8-oxo-dGTP diphosphatase
MSEELNEAAAVAEWAAEEAAFLAQYEPTRFPRPSVAVDVVLLTLRASQVRVLLYRRPEPPFKHRWALPGGFVRLDEALEDTARRVLRDKAGVEGVWLEQLYTFGDPDRDPRTRVLSVAYLALVDLERFRRAVPASPGIRDAAVTAVDDAGRATVTGDDGTRLRLAFDHDRIVGTSLTRLRGKLDYTPVGYQLLPERFTLRELQAVHETILGRPVNKDSFRRRMLASGELEATGEREQAVEHRPAVLYRFRARAGHP